MSEEIKHECGIALLRLLKPFHYYHQKYGTPFYGINKMYLLMEKQHNRGQDGAGLASVKFESLPGEQYIDRLRSNSDSPIKDIFTNILKQAHSFIGENHKLIYDYDLLKKNIPFFAELYLGHLRYGTFGTNDIENCHPFIRYNNWKTRNLILAGNFNLTNVDELFEHLVKKGQHPQKRSDTITILEKIAHFLDKEVENTFRKYKVQGYSNIEISELISQNLDISSFLRESCKRWDGGYVIAGLLGHGDAFVVRDPAGIRPAYYYHDDEIAVVTSERPVIQTAFHVDFEKIKEIKPGYALIIRKEGKISEEKILEPLEKRSCSFERIYFSRGTDAEIYQERKNLGRLLLPSVLKEVNYDLENTVFSYIPNTAEAAFLGLLEALLEYCDDIIKNNILKLKNFNKEELDKLFKLKPRFEKIAVKDMKLRTFITEDANRNDLVTHIYDVTYGSVRKHTDTLVILDDSIVRGTTLKQSIIKILDRLSPKKIIIVSSAPQIRYPDCYGIDIAKLSDFVAFEAAIELLKKSKRGHLISKVYMDALAEMNKPLNEIRNVVKDIYEPFTDEELSEKIAEILKPEDVKAEIKIIYQTIENLHKACPNYKGDWYFTGNYPTPGGNRVANRSYINYIEKKNERAY